MVGFWRFVVETVVGMLKIIDILGMYIKYPCVRGRWYLLTGAC